METKKSPLPFFWPFIGCGFLTCGFVACFTVDAFLALTGQEFLVDPAGSLMLGMMHCGVIVLAMALFFYRMAVKQQAQLEALNKMLKLAELALRQHPEAYKKYEATLHDMQEKGEL